MIFKALINILPNPEILDPQGKAVLLGLKHLGIESVNEVRIGKHITMQIEAETETLAAAAVEQSCQELLCNKIMESYAFSLVPQQ